MKKRINNYKTIATAFLIVVIASCNAGDTKNTTSDTAQLVPGMSDTLPPVVNPGTGDTTATMTTPPTNDNNSIMPDSTSIAQ